MAKTVLKLDRTADAPRRARARVRHLEADLGPERTDDAILLISELVTNAVKYGPQEGEVRVIITREATTVRFTVHDPGAGPLPEMRPSDSPPREGGGHGLRLVDKVADRWGVERGSTGVWFEIDR